MELFGFDCFLRIQCAVMWNATRWIPSLLSWDNMSTLEERNVAVKSVEEARAACTIYVFPFTSEIDRHSRCLHVNKSGRWEYIQATIILKMVGSWPLLHIHNTYTHTHTSNSNRFRSTNSSKRTLHLFFRKFFFLSNQHSSFRNTPVAILGPCPRSLLLCVL